jgi:hypothetical protein
VKATLANPTEPVKTAVQFVGVAHETEVIGLEPVVTVPENKPKDPGALTPVAESNSIETALNPVVW